MFADKKYLRYKRALYLLFSFLFALKLACLDDILFKDRGNYLIYLNNMDLKLEGIINSGIIFFEPLFYVLNSLLLFFLLPENALFAWILFVCFTIIYFSFRVASNIFLSSLLILLIFFQPQTFALMLVTTRQGIGLAILMWVLLSIKNEKYFIYALILSGFIHVSFFLVAFIYIIGFYFDSKEIKYITKYLIIGSISLVLNLAFYFLLNHLNLKQTYYLEHVSEVSGGAFVMWSIIFIYLLAFKKKLLFSEFLFVRIAYNFSVIGLILYLTSYFLSPIAGRIIGTFIPFIYFLLLYKIKVRDFFFVIFLLTLNIYLFFNGVAEGFLNVRLNVFLDNLLQ